MVSLKEHNDYQLGPIGRVPKDQKVICSSLFLKQKVNARFETPVVVRAYSQATGIGYRKTIRGTLVLAGSQGIVLATACQPDWPVHQVDVQVALLKSPVKGEVNVKMAPGQEETDYKTGASMVRKLKRGQYGLTQSLALRYGAIDPSFDPALLGMAFTTTASDPCIFTYECDDNLATHTPLRG